ncbi:Ankyrin-2 [Durusdinium trenchii]|uniref:Ankyrin-2 n=1 Tax=Durusdinium trenchii TaxID=1381693 RepID=A0ABP0MG68_9DINO
MGSHHGSNWLAGYFLELIFLVENVFVFHGIGEAFWASPKQVSRCLVLVAWAQIFFDVVFYMGLAEWLRSWIFLPYLLGLWLLSLGVSVLGHETAGSPAGSPVPGGAASDSSEAPSSPAADMLRNVMGSRLDMDGHCDSGFLVLREKEIRVPQEYSSPMALSRGHFGPLGLAQVAPKLWTSIFFQDILGILDVVTCVLLLADFFLDIDVVLTKIEQIPNTYVGFSSSALAALMIPELFALSQEMLSCFPLLHYGIGVILCIFGLQMLLQDLLVPWRKDESH